MRKVVSFPAGTHGNFLSLSINCLEANCVDFEVVSKTFDDINYSSSIPIVCVADLLGVPDDIGIVIDHELLYLHQLICRADAQNFTIKEYEDDFIGNSEKHSILKHIIDDFITINKKIYPKYDVKKLKWFYKNKVFGVLSNNESWRDDYPSRYKFPLTAFYEEEMFFLHMKQLVPNADDGMIKHLFDIFHKNIVHNTKNLHEFDSIMYESWQEYVG